MEQGKFWAYHDQAFEDQITLTKDAPLEIAEEVGLDLAAFKSCVASQRPKDYVARAEGQAERLGVSSTPTLYVNGQRLRVTRGLGPDLDAAVKAALGAPGA